MAPTDHGILHINIRKLTKDLIEPLERVLEDIKVTLLELAKERAEKVSKRQAERENSPQSLESMRERLEDKRVSDKLPRFADWVKDCNHIYDRQPKVIDEVRAIQELFGVADTHGFPILYPQMNARQDMQDESDRFVKAVEDSKERRKAEMAGMLVHLRDEIEDQKRKLQNIQKELTEPKSDYKNPKSPTQFIIEVKLGEVSRQLKQVKGWIDTLNNWQALFEQGRQYIEIYGGEYFTTGT
eukprot:gene12272-biopygen3875